MATKFSSIYKQELKSRGALESLGSTVVKSMAERVDLRNVLFGGKGFVAKTGRRIFGKGYDPIDRARKITPDSSAAVAAVASLQESNKRQEDALKVIVKNTMNMNMMARDMNITRQNIASLTKAVTGKSSKGADALWMNAEKRDREDRSTAPTKMGGVSSSILSGVLGGVMGIGGSVGSTILKALGSVIAISPILGIIGISASAYVIKQLFDNINFSEIGESIKKNVASFFGIDLTSEKGILQQLAENLDEKFRTDFFTKTKNIMENLYSNTEKFIRENFGVIIDSVSDQVKEVSITALNYTKAAFRTLADSFSGIGNAIGFLFSEFYESNKGKILAAITAGIALGVGGTKGKAGLVALGATGLAGLIGFASGESSREELKESIEALDKRIEEARKGGPEKGKLNEYVKQRNELQNKLEAKEKELKGYLSPDPNRFREYLREYNETPKSLKPSNQTQTSPTQISNKEMAQFIYGKFRDAGYEDAQARAAVANAIAESGLNPNEIARNGEDSYGLFQINMRDPSVSRFVKKTLGFTENDLLDPEKNVDAKIALMRTRTGDHAKFVKTTDPQKATEDFMKMFSRPTDTSDAAVNKRIGNLTAVNKLLGDTINQGSRELADANRPAAEKNPVIVNNNNTNVTKTAAPPQPIPNAFNVDVGELLFSQLVRGM